MEIRWQGSKWEGSVSLFYYFNAIFVHLLSPTSAVYSQKLPARSLAMAQMIKDESLSHPLCHSEAGGHLLDLGVPLQAGSA